LSDHQSGNAVPSVKLDTLSQKLDEAVRALEESRSFAKAGKLPRVLDLARRILMQPEVVR
jgi:hypothetical protein